MLFGNKLYWFEASLLRDVTRKVVLSVESVYRVASLGVVESVMLCLLTSVLRIGTVVWQRRRETMSERQNTLVCVFDPQNPRITARDIHEWIQNTMSLWENEVAMVQTDGPRRHVYIKFRDDQRRQQILTSTNRHGEFRHTNGEISNVRIEAAGLSMRRVKIANLPPEVPDKQYGWSWADTIRSRKCRKTGHVPADIQWPTASEQRWSSQFSTFRHILQWRGSNLHIVREATHNLLWL